MPRTAASAAYDPPHRVVFSWDIGPFSWDIGPQWQVEADPALCSEVEVRFVAEGASRTRVELEHRHIDRHGPGPGSLADGIGGDAGWPLYLDRYASVMAGSE